MSSKPLTATTTRWLQPHLCGRAGDASGERTHGPLGMDAERRAFLAHALQHLERGVIERIHRAFDIVMAPFDDDDHDAGQGDRECTHTPCLPLSYSMIAISIVFALIIPRNPCGV